MNIEEEFEKFRDKHEEGRDPKINELDRKGEWLHRYWFKAGAESQGEVIKSLKEDLKWALERMPAHPIQEVIDKAKRIRTKHGLDV